MGQRYAWIKRSLVSRQHEITDLEIRDAVQTGENEYEYLSDYRSLRKGEMYFTPDGTVFIRGTATIPEDFRGGPVWFTLHTAAEMMVKINGRPDPARSMAGRGKMDVYDRDRRVQPFQAG